MHNDTQEVYGSSRLVTALVLTIDGVRWGLNALWTSYLMHWQIFSVSHIHKCSVQAHAV